MIPYNFNTEDTLFIIGGDKIGNTAIKEIEKLENIKIIRDKSLGVKKIIKLIFNKKIKLGFLFKAKFAEIKRKNHNVKRYEIFKNLSELKKLLDKYEPKNVIIFRGSQIIPKNMLTNNINFFNIHYIDITQPDLRGLASIETALNKNSLDQFASFYKISELIDEGEIIAKEKYILDKNKSYLINEDEASNAGIRLIKNLFKIV
tara:strand:+ start:1082 stop:1690 length:609 start_codon:yes stop_codon:yes gene_type:complete